ncbi:Ligatin [Zea mays]|uniref:Ligatin n=2 Tax=Zea mays TaxID=4577 RepID=A0A1D6HAM7_MAIZE|nr:Ligatin [Zea mays]
MFKKPVDVKTIQRLSGADKKKLRRTAKGRFPQASDADLDAILPPKAEITVAKYPNHVLVYGIEGEFPMIFNTDARGHELFPTVEYAHKRKGAENKQKPLLPVIEYSHHYFDFLLSNQLLGIGNELGMVSLLQILQFMRFGSIPPEGFPSFEAGQPWAVKVPGNPAAIAVGSTTMSSTEALKAGLRGKALKILHYYRDMLWQVDSADGCYVPNEGFFDDIVVEDPNPVSTSQAPDSAEEPEVTNDGSVSAEDAGVDISDNHGTNPGIQIEAVEEITDVVNELKLPEDKTTEQAPVEMEHHNLRTEEIDSLLDKCLLQALYTSIKEKDLPMPGSTLWANHILPNRPPGVTIDIKKSSHKKLSKWLQSKSSSGLISAKEDKYKKEVVLLAINHKHPDYMAFRPEKRVQELVEHEKDVAESSVTKQLEVAEIYKPSSHVKPIFVAVEADMEKYYSAPEASDIVFRYVEKEKLVKPTDRAKVILDVTLCDALYKGAIKKGSAYPTEIHKKDLGSAFLNRMQVHHKVSRGTQEVIRKGAIRTIQIMTERRQGNKKMTRLSGLECFLMDPDSLASELQKKFACSTTTAELPGKKGQYEVLVQGGVIDDLAKHLVDHYDVPKRYIEVYDKTKR